MKWNDRGTPRQYEDTPTRVPKRFQPHGVGGNHRHLDSTDIFIVRTVDGVEREKNAETVRGHPKTSSQMFPTSGVWVATTCIKTLMIFL